MVRSLGLPGLLGLLLGLGVIYWLDAPEDPLNGGAIALILTIATSTVIVLGQGVRWLLGRSRPAPEAPTDQEAAES